MSRNTKTEKGKKKREEREREVRESERKREEERESESEWETNGKRRGELVVKNEGWREKREEIVALSSSPSSKQNKKN